MSKKQVKGIVESTIVSEAQSLPLTDETTAGARQEHTKNLFVKVDTFNPEGREIGTRIVDMYHFGTRNWLQNHHWWAMHNGHTVEAKTASQDEIGTYVNLQVQALADKHNHEKAHNAA